MARIRTIKPEFPQSESMGRVSREARLCFILMWTIADDAGRLRGNSRMLASLLYPYDDDASAHIDGWIEELEREGCVRRYTASSTTYAEILNWLEHQKIDRPSASKFPAFDETSRTLANAREDSSLDQGPRTKEGIKEGRESALPRAAPQKGTRLPSDWTLPEEWRDWAVAEGFAGRLDIDNEAAKFRDYWAAKTKDATKLDWFATWRNWLRGAKANGSGHRKTSSHEAALEGLYKAGFGGGEAPGADDP